MKLIRTVRQEYKISSIVIKLYEELGEQDQIFFNKVGSGYVMEFDAKTGKIVGLSPEAIEKTHRVYIKVVDRGIYELKENDSTQEFVLCDCYVPSFIPNDYGDYLKLEIENGVIVNYKRNMIYEMED